jgi:hypothetical protein
LRALSIGVSRFGLTLVPRRVHCLLDQRSSAPPASWCHQSARILRRWSVLRLGCRDGLRGTRTRYLSQRRHR